MSSTHHPDHDDIPSAAIGRDNSADFFSAELDLMQQIDDSFPARRPRSKSTSRAEKIRRDLNLHREIRQKLLHAERSFRDLEQAASCSSPPAPSSSNLSTQELDSSSDHQAMAIPSISRKKKESWRKKMKKSLSFRL